MEGRDDRCPSTGDRRIKDSPTSCVRVPTFMLRCTAKCLRRVVEKLRGLGWGEELDYMAPDYWRLAYHHDVKQAKKLTERGALLVLL